jgi:hypothetical protein
MVFRKQSVLEARFLTGLVAAVLAVLALAVAATARSATLPPGWSHAQVNVLIHRKAHTLIYDRGLVTRIAQASLTLREGDGSVVLVRVARSATVTLDGLPIPLGQLRRGEFAQTTRVDGAPARQVIATRVDPVG